MNFNHKTVLIEETLSVLNINSNGVYVDGTAGGGGLSKEIALRLSEKGKLICIDQDPDAIKVCRERLQDFKNVEIIHDNFSNVSNIVHNLGVDKIDGIVLDLGVSSYQLDSADRGFSYKQNARLDMRMSKEGKSAYDVVNFMKYEELRNIISKYGEERFAPRIAKNIVEKRERKSIETTLELADIVKESVPHSFRRDGGHPARKTFQAIRIYVNDELGNLEKGLDNSLSVLKKDGIMAIITFHSLEDRIVKQRMNFWMKPCTCPPEFPVCVCNRKPQVEIVSRKPIIPSDNEIEFNSRSRSAKLRVCKKI